MKKQNLIIIFIFLICIIGFYLISCKQDEEVIVQETVEAIDGEYVLVYVGGNVKRSGYFKVPSIWTVKELFEYVEVKSGVNINDYDLESIVENNKTYYINLVGSTVSYDEKVNINTANLDELVQKLDGIGREKALSIISYRQQHPFKSIEEIKKVSGIGDGIYAKIKDFITV